MKQRKDILTKVEQNMYYVYRTIMIVLLLCGYNFKTLTRSLLSKILANVYCLCIIIVLTYSTFSCCDFDNFSQMLSLVEYDISVITLLIHDSKVLKFIMCLSEIDVYLRVNRRHYTLVKKRAAVIIIALWTIRIGYTTLYCFSYKCFYHYTLFIINCLSYFALDINRVWRFIVLDTIRYRIKLLRQRLEEMPDCNYYLYVKDQKSIKEDKLRFCLKLYRKIGDLLDLIQPEMYTQLFFSIVCGVPKLIFDVYHALLVLEGMAPVTLLAFSVMHIIHVSFLLFAPSIVIEMYGVEIDRIRLYLIHYIIDNKDGKGKEDAELFLMYTNVRQFSKKIWRSIPVNINLPLEILGVIYSTILVIINFTHLYED